jgi:hypothetical protein
MRNKKDPRRMRLSVISQKQRSTMLSHELDVGVKAQCSHEAHLILGF